MAKSRIVLFVLTIILLISCRNHSFKTNELDPLREQIQDELNEIKVVDEKIIKLSFFVRSGSFQSITWGNDHLILTDPYLQELNLFTIDGNFIDKTGGIGKGPNEFESIFQLQKGPDGSLFVLDLFLKRLNKYIVTSNNIKYKTSYIIDSKEDYYIRKIYLTENGYYAVYNHIKDYFTTGENINYLYRLNDEFQPVEKILEIPGENKIKIDNSFFLQHPLPNLMLWTVSSGFFYMLNSHETTITKKNLLTHDTEVFRYLSDIKRINTPAFTDFFLKRLEPVIKAAPEAYDAIVDSETLPLNQSLLVQGDWIIIKTIYAGGESGTIIFVNQNSGKAYYGNVPPHFSAFSMIDNSLIGIDFTDLDNVQVKRITFDPDAFDTF